jgi:LPXTG-motif cell wall-anchored protein
MTREAEFGLAAVVGLGVLLLVAGGGLVLRRRPI